ncbi:MAG: tetratricopeptide repeat protein [bacterium]|nr:tetratricopeptide repeat protein [bacterium]
MRSVGARGVGILLWAAGSVLLPVAVCGLVSLPEPELKGLEEGVRERLDTARAALLAAVESPDTEAVERGRLYGHTGKVFHAHHVFPVAEACYANAAELDPEELLWPYLLGYIFEDTSRLAEAKKQFQKVLKLDPDHALATLRLARIQVETGEAEKAAPLLEKLGGEQTLAAPVRAALGKIATVRGEHAEAARHYEAALAAQPAASQLHYPLALAYRRLGEVEKAKEHASEAGTAKLSLPDPILEEVGSMSVSSQMFLTAGAQALKAERFDLAEKAFRGAIAVNPENKRAHLNLAVVMAQRQDFSGAEASAREALRLDPEYGFAYFNLGTVYEARGQTPEAMGFYRQALEKNPRNLKAHFRLAGALMQQSEYEAAAGHYRAVIEIAPSFVRARYLESLALIALRRYGVAREVLEEALRIHPEHVEMSRSLARLLATADPPDGARALAIARTLERDRLDDVETLAMALAATGRFDEAASAQQALLESARGSADPGTVQHLEYNLERYRRRQPSDRPWR